MRRTAAVSVLEDFTKGEFQEIIDDSSAPKKADRVILCSGKVYYDLVEHREKVGAKDAAIVRLEQLYPLHTERLAKIAKKYAGAKTIWCQEESQNYGAWQFLAPQLDTIFGQKPIYAGRDASSSPAVGQLAVHRIEQAALINDAFTL